MHNDLSILLKSPEVKSLNVIRKRCLGKDGCYFTLVAAADFWGGKYGKATSLIDAIITDMINI